MCGLGVVCWVGEVGIVVVVGSRVEMVVVVGRAMGLSNGGCSVVSIMIGMSASRRGVNVVDYLFFMK